jgi:hypothetical protein
MVIWGVKFREPLLFIPPLAGSGHFASSVTKLYAHFFLRNHVKMSSMVVLGRLANLDKTKQRINAAVLTVTNAIGHNPLSDRQAVLHGEHTCTFANRNLM